MIIMTIKKYNNTRKKYIYLLVESISSIKSSANEDQENATTI